MFKFIIEAGLLLLLAAAAFPALNVPLEVNNWADIARTSEPISAGVPLPSGGVYDLSKLRIADGSGNTVLCQFRALSRWWWEKNKNGVPGGIGMLIDKQGKIVAKGLTAESLATWLQKM